jgi:transposase
VLNEQVATRLPRVGANLRYLDVALALSLWRQLNLPVLFDAILPRSHGELDVADVIAALSIHRCVAPGSKLSAERWCPTTALPELLGFKPSLFNNSRVHRALETLESVEPELQDRLPEHVKSQAGAFVSLFLDVTNTHFVGHGPEFAHKGRLKDGRYARRIGIALLCDRRGLPLRWETLAGDYHDATAIAAFVEKVAKLPWVANVPLVVDRAMGQAGYLQCLTGHGVSFVTALPVNEFHAHTAGVPYQHLEQLKIAATKVSERQDLQWVHAAAERAGLHRVRHDRYVLDLGVLDKGEGVERRLRPLRSQRRDELSRVAKAIQFARELGAGREAGLSLRALARRHQCSWSTVRSHLQLLELMPCLQQRVLAGENDGAALTEVAPLAELPATQQQEAFEALLAKLREHGTPRRLGHSTQDAPPLRLRYIVHFNPQLFIEHRRNADEQLREIDASVADLNRRLRSPNSRRSEASVRAEVDRLLRSRNLLSVFDVEVSPVEESPTPTYVVVLRRNQEAWHLRRRYDGFNIIVAHPDLDLTATEIVELYFAKDAVERDFHTIKSVLEVRPVRHRTEPKVRAHVTLCVLALLLERTLEQRLKAARVPSSAATIFEALSTCHLNQLLTEGGSVYTVTQLTHRQRKLIPVLELQGAIDDAAVAAQITPR